MLTAEAIRANIDVFEGGGQVSAKFSRRRGHPPRTIFARIDRPMNALKLAYFVADGFHTNKLCSRLSLRKLHFLTENKHFAA